MAHTFISYSRQDQHFAFFLADLLKRLGYDVWMDRQSIPGGARWAAEIEKAVQECSAFTVLITPSALNSEWVNREIDAAVRHGKRIVPMLLEGEPPEALKEYQWVDLRAVLGEIEKAFPSSMTAFLKEAEEQLNSLDKGVRVGMVQSITALLASGRDVPHALLTDRLRDSSPDVRRETAQALGSLHAAWALNDLIASLDDPYPDVRSWVVWALGKIGDTRALEPLLELQRRETNDDVLFWIADALANIPPSEIG